MKMKVTEDWKELSDHINTANDKIVYGNEKKKLKSYTIYKKPTIKNVWKSSKEQNL